MRSISQRELRNDSGEIMRQLSRGVGFHVTSRGVTVATLVPFERDALEELSLREGTQQMVFPPGVRVDETTAGVLTQLRGER